MEKPTTININLKQLTDHIIIVGGDISKEELNQKITDLLLKAVSRAEYIINKQEELDDPLKITTRITLKTPKFSDSVEVVTDPDTGERYGRIPFEHTNKFQIVKVTKLLEELGDGTYLITVVPEQKEIGKTGPRS